MSLLSSDLTEPKACFKGGGFKRGTESFQDRPLSRRNIRILGPLDDRDLRDCTTTLLPSDQRACVNHVLFIIFIMTVYLALCFVSPLDESREPVDQELKAKFNRLDESTLR